MLKLGLNRHILGEFLSCSPWRRSLSTAKGTEGLPHRIAIVGSGPSAFYAAKYLLNHKSSTPILIDMFEKLPFPFGLVRFGVAPDHPEVKSVTKQFQEVVQEHRDRFRFFGNIEVSDLNPEAPVSLEMLEKNYSAVLFAYGASEDHSLGLPGEDSVGVLSARSFVNWYNGHPHYQNLPGIDFESIKRVVIIGQGNVALDCGRIWAKDRQALATTDITSQALRCLASSPLEHVVILGRRGHVQSSFTIKELREMSRLEGARLVVLRDELDKGWTAASREEAAAQASKTRILQLLDKLAQDTEMADVQIPGERTIELRFLLQPLEIVADTAGRIKALKVARTELVGDAFKQKAVKIEPVQEEVLKCDLLIKAVGYRSVPISSRLPFDEKKNIVVNQAGRVKPGWYVTGWLRRGPTGIIGSNITDARETVATILEDLSQLQPKTEDPTSLFGEKFHGQAVSWDEVLEVEKEEKARGEASHPPKPSEKIVFVEEALKIARRRQ